MMRVYATNYAQLCRLPPHNNISGRNGDLSGERCHYCLTLNECTRYTSPVKIDQTLPVVKVRNLPAMTVRPYHDAMVAEVRSSQQVYRFKARYDYPNKKYGSMAVPVS
ncbi:MAG: DUF1249 domain-containing protein [Serratia symbiotica]|nr:DUF1249 domain-containing protein [Serratia symbiotica]